MVGFHSNDLTEINGVPVPLDAVFEDFEKELYFVQDGLAAKFDSTKIEVSSCETKVIASQWFECDSPKDTKTCVQTSHNGGVASRQSYERNMLLCHLLAFLVVVRS